jgi:glycosyltransferase involved in cell wall biosynthesis
MPEPLVSVVMPTFNRLEYVREAVASVYAQTCKDWELVIVDDGSEDETREFLRAAPDSRTSVVFHTHTGKPAVVRNIGIARARGRYVAFLDSDDRWPADKLRRQLALMESAPTRRWSYTAMRLIDADGRVLDDGLLDSWVPRAGSIVEELLRFQAGVPLPTVMADLALVREVGGFDENLRFVEDYDLWLRMAMRSEVSVDPTPLCDVRSHRRRFTTGEAVGALEGWVSFFRKMEGVVPTSRLRALCRRRAGEHVLLLAAEQARVRNWTAMRRCLAEAARGRVFSPGGWLRVAKAVALSRR